MVKIARILGLALTALAAGCATTTQFRSSMDRFIGRPLSEAKEAFGYRYTALDLEDGGKVYTWRTVRTGTIPSYESPTVIESDRYGDRGRNTTVYPGTYYPAQVYQDTCEFSLVTDPTGRVLRWNARGEGCRGEPAGPVLRSGPKVSP